MPAELKRFVLRRTFGLNSTEYRNEEACEMAKMFCVWEAMQEHKYDQLRSIFTRVPKDKEFDAWFSRVLRVLLLGTELQSI